MSENNAKPNVDERSSSFVLTHDQVSQMDFVEAKLPPNESRLVIHDDALQQKNCSLFELNVDADSADGLVQYRFNQSHLNESNTIYECTSLSQSGFDNRTGGNGPCHVSNEADQVCLSTVASECITTFSSTSSITYVSSSSTSSLSRKSHESDVNSDDGDNTGHKLSISYERELRSNALLDEMNLVNTMSPASTTTTAAAAVVVTESGENQYCKHNNHANDKDTSNHIVDHVRLTSIERKRTTTTDGMLLMAPYHQSESILMVQQVTPENVPDEETEENQQPNNNNNTSNCTTMITDTVTTTLHANTISTGNNKQHRMQTKSSSISEVNQTKTSTETTGRRKQKQTESNASCFLRYDNNDVDGQMCNSDSSSSGGDGRSVSSHLLLSDPTIDSKQTNTEDGQHANFMLSTDDKNVNPNRTTILRDDANEIYENFDSHSQKSIKNRKPMNDCNDTMLDIYDDNEVHSMVLTKSSILHDSNGLIDRASMSVVVDDDNGYHCMAKMIKTMMADTVGTDRGTNCLEDGEDKQSMSSQPSSSPPLTNSVSSFVGMNSTKTDVPASPTTVGDTVPSTVIANVTDLERNNNTNIVPSLTSCGVATVQVTSTSVAATTPDADDDDTAGEAFSASFGDETTTCTTVDDHRHHEQKQHFRHNLKSMSDTNHYQTVDANCHNNNKDQTDTVEGVNLNSEHQQKSTEAVKLHQTPPVPPLQPSNISDPLCASAASVERGPVDGESQNELLLSSKSDSSTCSSDSSSKLFCTAKVSSANSSTRRSKSKKKVSVSKVIQNSATTIGSIGVKLFDSVLASSNNNSSNNHPLELPLIKSGLEVDQLERSQQLEEETLYSYTNQCCVGDSQRSELLPQSSPTNVSTLLQHPLSTSVPYSAIVHHSNHCLALDCTIKDHYHQNSTKRFDSGCSLTSPPPPASVTTLSSSGVSVPATASTSLLGTSVRSSTGHSAQPIYNTFNSSSSTSTHQFVAGGATKLSSMMALNTTTNPDHDGQSLKSASRVSTSGLSPISETPSSVTNVTTKNTRFSIPLESQILHKSASAISVGQSTGFYGLGSRPNRSTPNNSMLSDPSSIFTANEATISLQTLNDTTSEPSHKITIQPGANDDNQFPASFNSRVRHQNVDAKAPLLSHRYPYSGSGDASSAANQSYFFGSTANSIARTFSMNDKIDNYPTSPFERSLSYSNEATGEGPNGGDAKMEDHNTFYSVTLPKLKYLKVFLLASLIIYTLISFIFIQEKEEKWTNVAVQDKMPAFVDLSHSLDLMFPVWKLRARGAFLPNEYANLTNYSVVFTIVQLLNNSQGGDRNGQYRVVKRPWAAPVAPYQMGQYINPKEVEHVFKLTRGDAYDHIHRYQLRIDTNSEESIGLTVNMAGFSELSADGIILASAVLIFLYTLIIFEIVNRTLAAMLGATAAITCLTLIRDRPSLEKVVSWLDVETLCLLFGMMILVAILCETGFFDYIAVIAFRLAKGRTWPLIFTLCFFTGVLSAFLDNVTTILLMTPVTIRLCEIKNIDPKHVLISLVIFSNIGGAATPVGDPPNVIIISSFKIQQQGVDFGRFTLHMMPGIIICFIATLIFIRIYYRDLSNLEFQDTNTSEEEDTDNLKEFLSQHRMKMVFNNSNNPSSGQPRSVSEGNFSLTNTTPDTNTTQNVGDNKNQKINKQIHHSNRSPNSTDILLDASSDLDNNFSPSRKRQFNISCPGGGQTGITNSNRLSMMDSVTLNRCLSCNNLEEFCAGTSLKESIFDERRVFRSSDELKREIEVWKRACNSIAGYSRDENSVRTVLNRKVEILETILRQHCYETVPPEDNYLSVLAELESKYQIRDRPLLIKSGIVMSLVISLFFMQSIPNMDLSLGWIAILGAILLLVLSDRHELESIIARVEWSTLIFFAALFVVMEALAELKFLWWIGRLTQDFINSVPEQHRLVVAILVFIWISALSSSFIDNIPLTTVMVKIIEDLAENNEFNIPLMPLIYALAFGACLGGNGTLIGASSNVVCAGVAEQHGYRFTFMDFFRVGFPIMLITVAISTVYLILCHVVFDWNY